MSLPTHCHAMLPKITRVTAQTCSMSAYNYRSCVSSKTFARSLSKTFVPWNQQQYQVSRQKFFSSTSKRLSKKKDGPGIGKSIEGKGRGGLWEWWTAPVDMPPRKSVRWYAEMALVSTVFGVTGSTTMFLVRPAITDFLHLHGSMKDGPWSYRLTSLVIMTPLYPLLLVTVGTIAGRHAYFRYFAVKMFSRFGIPHHQLGGYGVYGKGGGKVFKKW
mmetsp:Transcript_25829/g.59460  ORF Transcript_25829/g.59460 Transcript_25829/m.59460 type:complete len:216 (-) Transcript_25829:432-1079(-)